MDPAGCFPITKKKRNLYLEAVAGFGIIGSATDLDAVAEGSVWHNFERLAAYIFEKNGFSVSVGTVKIRDKKRRQYDVIAKKDGRTLLVECKQWAKNRYRLSALKQAVARHRERAEFFAGVTGTEAVPVIVTLVEEEIRMFEGVPLVPVHRLNAFISELESMADGWSFAEYEARGDFPDVPEENPEYTEYPDDPEYPGISSCLQPDLHHPAGRCLPASLPHRRS